MLACRRAVLTRIVLTLLTLTGSVRRAPAQAAPAFAPLNQYSFGVEYSNSSNHVILGQAFNRRLAGLDLTYSRRIGRKHWIAYDWDIEVRPVVFLQDPTRAVTETINFSNNPATFSYRVPAIPIQSRCSSSETRNTVRTGTTSTGVPIFVTVDENDTCGSRWTYAGGASPVGQRLSFLPTRRVQPFLLANGGFLVSPHDVPVNDSSQFNFTFTFGGGFTWFARGESAWSLDYRVHHLSNKNLGNNNPGVDSQTLRLSYTVPRLRRRYTR